MKTPGDILKEYFQATHAMDWPIEYYKFHIPADDVEKLLDIAQSEERKRCVQIVGKFYTQIPQMTCEEIIEEIEHP